MKMHISKIWENTTKVQRIFLSFWLTFQALAGALTWYGITFLGLTERTLSVAQLIETHGAPLGLFVNYLLALLFIIPVWFAWANFSSIFSRRRRWVIDLSLILIILFTFAIMGFFWVTVFDFAHDWAIVAFRLNVFNPVLGDTANTILALISTAIYLAFSPDFKKMACRKHKESSDNRLISDVRL
jgi:hypothetical protein